MNERQIARVGVLSRAERAAYQAYHRAFPGAIAECLATWRYAMESLAYYVSEVVK